MKKMGDVDTHEERSASPPWALDQFPEDAIRVSGETVQNVHTGSANMPPLAPGHRRSQSEVASAGHKRSNSFSRWKTQMQKAWRWGGNVKEQERSSFNPEILANQKRQWYRLNSKSMERKRYMEPTSLFEHFVIVGLHPDANLEAVENAFAKRKTWELEMAKSEIDLKMLQYRGPSIPTLEPQILFKYPTGKKLALQPKDLPSFCFPGGVKARLLERTPSMSDLNEVVYGQEHLNKDDLAFIFSLKVADSATLYGVCLHVQEIVQRPPGILGGTSPISQSSGRGSRFLVSAPRCYCVLTRIPFFELHYEMLNSIIAQERLDRITQFVSEVTLSDSFLSGIKIQDQMNENNDSPNRDCYSDWMDSAIPLDNAVALSAAAVGLISDDRIPSFSSRLSEPQSPESGYTSEQYFDDYAPETSEALSESFERMNGNYENGQMLPDISSFICSKSRKLERVESSESLLSCSVISEDEDDEVGNDIIIEWAKEHKNKLLQIICSYQDLSVPARGNEIIFEPLEHLQAIKYSRPPISSLELCGNYTDIQGLVETDEVNARLAAAEEALALSIWTTATVCRVLSLESVLALFSGVLLEKQIVVVCPNLGVLSATVLSLIPMIRPFEWQSLLLPVLPKKMLDFLDAPVPYVVGIQQKPADLKMKTSKTSNIVHVNVQKDQVKMCYLPPLPRRKELIAELGPIHARLSCENVIAKKHPVYKCNEVQAEAAGKFLNVMRRYLESLCSDLQYHSITSVQSNNDRVSLLLKDSFIDSFPSRDRPFIKLLVDTQLFSVLSDSRLSSYENVNL
ncbi:PREDICTED: uncharacterized protein LOC104602732 isoform X2 [Nelumbo nucifera]|uniref:Uncharacterized protein LOC104602732 isoform X2 n=1 Tax=Nelumbo nucifera TaxID=4432 RepID=A0A1U8ABI6_NELNU|nr:PREDICTED: uncharacterized protein LOC104602732 isoform X2 [Nelumbo nucifera]